jgi:hypothetical protein
MTYRLENRTLAGGLIATDYNLREFNYAAKILTTQVIHDIQDLALLVALQSFEAVGRDAIRINRRTWLGAVTICCTRRHFVMITARLKVLGKRDEQYSRGEQCEKKNVR